MNQHYINIILIAPIILLVATGFIIRIVVDTKIREQLYKQGKDPNPREMENIRRSSSSYKEQRLEAINFRKTVNKKLGSLYEKSIWLHTIGVIILLINALLNIIIDKS